MGEGIFFCELNQAKECSRTSLDYSNKISQLYELGCQDIDDRSFLCSLVPYMVIWHEYDGSLLPDHTVMLSSLVVHALACHSQSNVT
jgi:hypothetical protein